MGGKRTYEQDRFFESSLDKACWQAGEDPQEWDACWYTGMPDPEYFSKVGPDCKINHIPGNNALTVKSRLYQSLVTLRERVEVQQRGASYLTDRLQFVPRVFSMPEDYHEFQQEAFDNPSKRWLLKPKNAARGKGIQLVQDPANIPLDSSWMVQEYIDNPHTMRGRKYVLRLYVAITSVAPLRVYLYRQGFAKLASEPYDEENADNPYSYLTNPDINALNLDAEVPVEFVDLERYRAWLREQGHDNDVLFAKIEDLVALTCLSAVEAMRERSRAIGADTRGCYELLGIDCLIDDQLKPWICECNLSPSLEVCAGPESGGEIEEAIKGSLVADLVSLVGLNGKTDSDSTGTPEQQLIVETTEELSRAGNFKRLLPSDIPARYLPFYTLPRLEDWVLAQAISGEPLTQPTLRRRYAEDMISDDCVYVYDTRLGHLSALNETGSLIWLMATDGAAPDEIADALNDSIDSEAADRPDIWAIRRDVWNSLADWVGHQLLVQDDPSGSSVSVVPRAVEEESHGTAVQFSRVLECGAFRVELCTDSQPLINRIESLLVPMLGESAQGAESRLEIVRDTPGYTLILDGKVIQSRLALSRVAPAVMVCLTRRAADRGEIILDAGVVAAPDDPESAVLIANSDRELGDLPALEIASHLDAGFSRAIRIPEDVDGLCSVLGLPAQVPESKADAAGKPYASPIHHLADGSGMVLQAASSGLAGETRRIQAVLIPSHVSLREKTGIRRLSVSETMRHFIPGCCGADGQPLGTAAFSRLADWLAGIDRYLVDANHLDTAVANLPLGQEAQGVSHSA
ncbi:amylase [Marinobacter sp. NP-4(2019)]|nr:amylase [Marinobacter sp. NP-4(2019)]